VVANLLFMGLSGLAMVAVTAVFALIGSDMSPTFLVLSFALGVFCARVAIMRLGSAAAVWRRLRQPPA
jgi:hypothetical protein